MRHEEYSPRWDLADRLRNRFDTESYDVYEFHGDNNGDPDSGASDDQTSVSGAAGASTSLPDCAPEDPACHPHRAFQSYGYPGYGPSVPPGYPHGPFVEPDMGVDDFGYIPPPLGRGQGGFMNRLHHHFRNMIGQPQPPYGGQQFGQGIGQPQPPYGGQQFGRGIGQPGAPPPPVMGWEDPRHFHREGWRGDYHHQGGFPGQPAPPIGAGAPPPPGGGGYTQSWQRWQQVHPGSSYQDYQNWVQQYGAQGATINGEGVQFGGEGSLGDEDLCGGFDMRG